MTPQDRQINDTDAIDLLRHALKSQYHASLATLRQAIDKCPDDLWVSDDYLNPFWRIAYHSLYFLHLYIQPHVSDFCPWEHHQEGAQDMDDYPSPPEIEALFTPHDRPKYVDKVYTKAEVLEYADFCEQMIDDAVDALDLLSPESGFVWYKISKIEFQFVTIRHLQHHAAQLGERLRTSSDIELTWVGARGRKPGGGA